jgi:hypothetical protein
MGGVMKGWLIDGAIACGLFAIIVMVMLFSGADSSFIYVDF